MRTCKQLLGTWQKKRNKSSAANTRKNDFRWRAPSRTLNLLCTLKSERHVPVGQAKHTECSRKNTNLLFNFLPRWTWLHWAWIHLQRQMFRQARVGLEELNVTPPSVHPSIHLSLVLCESFNCALLLQLRTCRISRYETTSAAAGANVMMRWTFFI